MISTESDRGGGEARERVGMEKHAVEASEEGK